MNELTMQELLMHLLGEVVESIDYNDDIVVAPSWRNFYEIEVHGLSLSTWVILPGENGCLDVNFHDPDFVDKFKKVAKERMLEKIR